MTLGFSREDCAHALRTCGGQLDEAALWLTQNSSPVKLGGNNNQRRSRTSSSRFSGDSAEFGPLPTDDLLSGEMEEIEEKGDQMVDLNREDSISHRAVFLHLLPYFFSFFPRPSNSFLLLGHSGELQPRGVEDQLREHLHHRRLQGRGRPSPRNDPQLTPPQARGLGRGRG